MLKQPSKRLLAVSAAAVVLLLAILWLVPGQQLDRGIDSPFALPVAAVPEKGLSDGHHLRIRSEREQPLRFAEGQQDLKIALDEVVLRDAQGRDHLTPLKPPATPGTLRQRLEEMNAPMGVLPVAYLEGQERNDASRRLVTSEIRAKMPRRQAEQLAREHGLRIKAQPDYAPDWVIFSADRPLDALAKIEGLRSEDSVESADVLLAVQHEKKAMPNDPMIAQQWHLKASGSAVAGSDVNIESAWRYGQTGGVRGTGVRIGIVDDGLQTAHPDLIANVDTGNDKDWNGGDGDPNPGVDDDHGTACAGVAGARGNNSLGVSGTAPEATLVGMRLIAAATTDQQDAEAMTYLPDLIPIKSNSWGSIDDGMSLAKIGDLTHSALVAATTSGRGGKGSIIIFAGGNGGRSSVRDNSNYDGFSNSIYTVAVGATDSLGRRADYSEPGANIVVCAPSLGSGGLGITTTDRTGTSGYNTLSGTAGDYSSNFNGTSASTPAVAGIVALMLEKNPTLGWRDVQEILIRSAQKISPGDADWQNNSAGFHFNHNFGAGLVDATAAVTMASTWTNLGTHTSLTSTQTNLGPDIPNNSATGITREFVLSSANVRVEHVTLRLNINHAARGELEISLTSPSGMVSRLAEVRQDSNPHYSDWTFSSVRNWGEMAAGTWILKIADRSSVTTSTGYLTAAELNVFGAAASANPAPVVRITSPVSGSMSSPGTSLTVHVTAEDFDMNGSSSPVTEVQLFRNSSLVETRTAAPYSFSLLPPNGGNVFEARAKDVEGKVGVSAPVVVTVANQAPVVQSVTLSGSGQLYSDMALSASVSASDPESDPVTLSYQWQFSTDQEIYTDLSGATSASLPVSPSNSRKLWRCLVHASDGNSKGEPLASAPVNLLERPTTNALPGSAYSYQSGLVLKGVTTSITRQAIIHEFSQGPSGGTAEWIEILTMKPGSFRKWSILDAEGSVLRFRDSAVWDNIPAGTLIVIYNGASKDPLLPAESSSSSSGEMVLASTNASYFDQALGSWPPLGNSGDAIFLTDASGLKTHQVAYGNSAAASPNIGSVVSGAAGYFIGDSDLGADQAEQWRVTTSATARSLSSLAEPKALTPAAALSGGRYAQDFNTTPGPSGTSYPSGWTSYNQGTTNSTLLDDAMTADNGSSVTSGNYNYGSRIGILGASQRFDPGFLALALQDTNDVSGLKISYDVIKVAEQGRNIDFDLQYTFSSPGSSGTAWIPIPGARHNSGSTAAGTVTSFKDIPLPAEFDKRSGKIYLRWYYRTSPGSPGSGGWDALALDNVLISSDQSPNVTLGLSLNPTTISEAGGYSTGTITIDNPQPQNLTIQLSSSDTSEAWVPSSVILWANHSSATFAIRGVDDDQSDGPQTVVITATAAGIPGLTASLIVADNEAKIHGVTPAKANTPSNESFITKLRNNTLSSPPKFRLSSGTVLPVGLSLNLSTGLISGTISSSAAVGSYPINIELTNVLDQTTSQKFVLNVSNSIQGDYASWIAGFDVTDKTAVGDSDRDGLPNLVEYALGTSPDQYHQPAGLLLEKTATSISFTYPRSKSRDDVSLFAEWSATLVENSWQRSGITEAVVLEGLESRTIRASLPITPEDPQRFLRLRAEMLQASP